MRLDIELYQDGEVHGAWITDRCGGSGIEVEAVSYEEFAAKVGAYIADYAFAENARRNNEIAQYGKLVSLRPSIAHKSKKTYSRKDKSWKYNF